MAWESNLDAVSKKSIFEPKVASPQPNLDPNVAKNLSNIKQRAGWVPIETQLALAKANASDRAIDAVGKMAAQKTVDKQAESQNEGQSFFGKQKSALDFNIKNLRAVSKWLTATLDLVPELTQGAASQALENAGEYGIGDYGQGTDRINNIDGWFASTKLGSLLKAKQGDFDPVTGERITTGSGFFVPDEVLERAGERARRYRGTIGPYAFTIGRGAANTVFTPGTPQFNVFSGVIDGLILIGTDPTNIVSKAVKNYRNVTQLVPRLSKADAAVLREAVTFDAGFVPTLFQVGLDETKYAQFMASNYRAKLLVEKLRKETDVVKVFDIFDQNPNISNEMLTLLANSKTDEQVKAVLALGFQLEKGGLTDQIRLLQKSGFILNSVPIQGLKNISGKLFETTNMANSKFVRKGSQIVNRYLTEMPTESLIINGDRLQNTQGTKTVINFLRTVGADKETVARIGAMAVEAFTQTASQVDQYAFVKVFDSAIDEAMRANGVARVVRKEVLEGAKASLDRVNKYMVDRVGTATDNGLATFLANEYNAYLPAEEIETLIKTFGEGGDFQIISPLQISEMLKRVHVLPDVRTLRRLTSNRFFGFGENLDVEAKTKVDAFRNKFGTTSGKTRRREVTKIIDEDKFDELTNELTVIQKDLPRYTEGTPEANFASEEIKRIQKELNSLKKTVSVRIRTGEERDALKVIDYLQNQLWKPLALMTGGYVVRNSLDAQVRMAFSGLPSVFTHPFEYIQLVLGGAKNKTLTGEFLTGRKLEEYTGDIREAYTFGLRQQGFDDKMITDHMIKTGNWQIVERTDIKGAKLHTDAVAQNGVLVYSGDPLQKIVAQTIVEFGGASYDAIIVARQRVVKAIKDDPKIYKLIKDSYASRKLLTNSEGVKAEFPEIFFEDLSEDQIIKILTKHAETVPIANVQMMTGNMSDIEFAYAFNRIPLRDNSGNIAPTIRSTIGDLQPAEVGELRVGSTVLLGDPTEPSFGVIVRVVDAKTGARYADDLASVLDPEFFVAEVQPIMREKSADGVTYLTAFGNSGLGTKEFRRIVSETPLWDGTSGLPRKIKREQLATERNTVQLRQSFDQMTNWFFGSLYGSTSRKLDRSPVFRKYYYEEISKNADQLDPEGAKTALKELVDSAKEAKKSVKEYVGDEVVGKLNKALTGNGTATLEELDDFAKFASLQKTKALLYDASNRTNLEDAMKVVLPFGPAWREVVGTYSHLFREDPLKVFRNTTRIINGAKTADPDNDGRGFFYEDPITNALTFLFPFSGLAAKALTGLDASLKAPTGRLSQGLQVIPGLGPVYQIVASQLLRFVPAPKEVVELLLPYGRKNSIGGFFPGWATKLLGAIEGDTNKLGTVYANTYTETLLALSTTGKYDMSNPDEIRLLQQDARGKAQWLTGFRALSQLLGPTAGSTEFKVTAKTGDVYASELSKQFYALQTKDYDSSIQTFLDMFGDEVSLYVSSKSKANVQGLEATEQFGDWEKDNKDLLKEFPQVAAYLAPAGDDFSFAVWESQIVSGKRDRLTDKEIVDLAQNRIGSAKYRWARKQIGQFPNEKSRVLLKQYRAALHAELPGFPLVAEFRVGEYDNNVEDMKTLVNDPRVADSSMAKSIKKYIDFRDATKQVALQYFGSDNIGQSKQTQVFRDKLASIGEMIILENPDFARVWQRFFSYEVEE